MGDDGLKLEIITSCEHWSRDQGCSLGLFGGVPEKDDCASCMRYVGPSRGLGDVVHSALGAVGIHALLKSTLVETQERNEKLAKEKKEQAPKKEGGCGCGRRRKALNKLLPTKGTN